MKYQRVIKGEFISRPNRFIAKVTVDGKEEIAHVKNTGRCKELLTGGETVYLSVSDNPLRKTNLDLICVRKKTKDGTLLINMDSMAPNKVTEEWLKKGNIFSKDAVIHREATYKNSRFDFYIEDKGKKAFLEVKGVTLEEDGIVKFPDAPTQRGVKHINELISCVNEGYDAYILFVIQMKEAKVFRPNDETHKAFGDAIRNANKEGVKILAVNCNVKEDSLDILDYVKIEV